MVKSIYAVEYMDLLLLLRQKRLAAGLTQVQLARFIGMSRSFIGKIERGERRLDVIELEKICNAVGIGIVDFIIELQQRQGRG